MNLDRIVMAVAGGMTPLSVTLTYLFSPWWLLVSAFVGANMLQLAFTGFCPLALVLKRFGVTSGPAF